MSVAVQTLPERIEEPGTEDWHLELFVPNCYSEKERALYERHKPLVDVWLQEFALRKDPSIETAQQAASSLLSYLSSFQDKPLDWTSFNAEEFVLEDLAYGWTMHMYGCYKVFFDQLLEAFRRFVDAGLLDRGMGERYLAELESLREQYLEKYRPLTAEEEAEQTARFEKEERDYWESLLTEEAPVGQRNTPSPHKRVAARAHRKKRRKDRRR